MFERMFSKEFIFEQRGKNRVDDWMFTELERCYAEIERQRALIERAKSFVNHCIEYGTSAIGADMAREWLKDASGWQEMTPTITNTTDAQQPTYKRISAEELNEKLKNYKVVKASDERGEG